MHVWRGLALGKEQRGILLIPMLAHAGLACPHLGVMSSEKGVIRWLHSVGVDMNMQVGVCQIHRWHPDNKTVNFITINEGIPPSHLINCTHIITSNPQIEHLEHQIVIVFTLGIRQRSNSSALCH